MRLTLVSPFDPAPAEGQHDRAHVGGVERVFAEIGRHLGARGHDVTLLCSSDGVNEDRHHEGVHVRRRPRKFTLLRAPVAQLDRHLGKDSGLVHVPATYPFTTGRVLRRAQELGLRRILDFHFEPAPGTLIGRIAARAYGSFGPRAYQLADRVLVRSMAYGRSAPSLRAIPEDRWRVVPNGIDPERFRPNGNRGSGDYLLFVGRLVPYKGLPVLLKAMSIGKIPLPLYVVGDGPLRARLQAESRDLGVDARFLGRVDEAALPDLYRHARLTVLPSVTRQEAFGLSLLESLACGTPVVASDLPGVADLAALGGRVARRGDAHDLARTLREAIADPALPRHDALASPIHAAYSWKSIARQLEAVYEELQPAGA